MYSSEQLFLIYSGLFFGVLVFSLIINSVFLRFARTLGIRDRHAELVRWSSASKPAFGGIGFFICFLGCFALYSTLFPKFSQPLDSPMLGLLAATGLGFLMGLADDAYNTRPFLKFLVQLTCGAILLFSGTSIHLFGVPWADGLFTLIWVVGMMNSINMLDNMDAITTIVSIFILLCALLVVVFLGPLATADTVLIIGCIAALTGFLFFNWSPSRLFMGDTGSQFLGVYLGYIGIRFFWNMPGDPGEEGPWRQICAVLVVFLLPIVDTTTVTINRILRGRSPFIGGKDHTTHHLGYTGLSDAQVALVFIGLSAVALFLTFVLLRFVPVWGTLHTVFALSYALLLFGTLYGLTRKQKKEHR
mgnify:CR=1 FL=1